MKLWPASWLTGQQIGQVKNTGMDRKEGEVWEKNGPDYWVLGIANLPLRNTFTPYFGIFPPPRCAISPNTKKNQISLDFWLLFTQTTNY